MRAYPPPRFVFLALLGLAAEISGALHEPPPPPGLVIPRPSPVSVNGQYGIVTWRSESFGISNPLPDM